MQRVRIRVRVPVAVAERELRFNLSDSGQVKIQLECDCQRAKNDSAKSTSPTQCKWHQSETNYTCMCVRVCESVSVFAARKEIMCATSNEASGRRMSSRGEGDSTPWHLLGLCIMCAEIFLFIWQKLWHTHTHANSHTIIHAIYTTCNTPRRGRRSHL